MADHSELEQVQLSVGCLAKLAGAQGRRETWPSGDEWYAILHLIEGRMEDILKEPDPGAAHSRPRSTDHQA